MEKYTVRYSIEYEHNGTDCEAWLHVHIPLGEDRESIPPQLYATSNKVLWEPLNASWGEIGVLAGYRSNRQIFKGASWAVVRIQAQDAIKQAEVNLKESVTEFPRIQASRPDDFHGAFVVA